VRQLQINGAECCPYAADSTSKAQIEPGTAAQTCGKKPSVILTAHSRAAIHPSMSTFRFGRIDSRSPLVAWSLAAICLALLSLLIIDARLVAQYLATLLLSALTAGIAIIGVGRLRANAIAKRRLRSGSDPA